MAAWLTKVYGPHFDEMCSWPSKFFWCCRPVREIGVASGCGRHVRPDGIVVRVFENVGISGTKDREEFSALDAMLEAVARPEVDMVAAWLVDRSAADSWTLLVLLREQREVAFVH
jgi:hypothetical protein